MRKSKNHIKKTKQNKTRQKPNTITVAIVVFYDVFINCVILAFRSPL